MQTGNLPRQGQDGNTLFYYIIKVMALLYTLNTPCSYKKMKFIADIPYKVRYTKDVKINVLNK